MSALDEAAAQNPGVWWWLQADGCDVNKGLKESAKLKWSGDVDLPLFKNSMTSTKSALEEQKQLVCIKKAWYRI